MRFQGLAPAVGRHRRINGTNKKERGAKMQKRKKKKHEIWNFVFKLMAFKSRDINEDKGVACRVADGMLEISHGVFHTNTLAFFLHQKYLIRWHTVRSVADVKDMNQIIPRRVAWKRDDTFFFWSFSVFFPVLSALPLNTLTKGRRRMRMSPTFF